MAANVDEIAISIGEPEIEAYTSSDGKKLPTAQFLLDNNPTRTGYLDKQNTSLLSRCLYPWKTRFFILIGGYLFRYADAAGKKPKGVPIPLDAVTINRCEDGDSDGGRCFEVVTIRKVYILRAISQTDCEEWVSAIKDRKSLSIAENMGHRNVSSAITQINKQAAKAFEKTVDNDSKFGMSENPMHSTIIMGR